MIMHIMKMYYSKYPRTQDEILPYVQHRYNIALSATSLFRCAWVSNHWSQLMQLYPLHHLLESPPMLKTKQTNQQNLLNKSSTSANKSMTFWKMPILNTSNEMTNIMIHKSSRLGIWFGCIYRKRVSQEPITSFFHFDIGHTPSPRQFQLHL